VATSLGFAERSRPNHGRSILPLASNDPVSECIGTMGDLLQLLPVNCLLTNGKIEKQLKFFLGAAWERGNPITRAYAMDKRPFDGFELDLLTFEDGRPKFWIEAKASFQDDWNDVQRCAEKALNQATARIGSVARRSQGCAGYIVHFLTSLPQPAGIRLPQYMWDVFERLREPQPSELLRIA
jgi:hypothetical protein